MRLFYKLNRSIRKHGFARTLACCVRSLPELIPRRNGTCPWDEECNVNTEDPANIGDLHICPGGDELYGIMYVPITPVKFEMAMAALPGTANGCTFIDYGSGKGRALLL